MVVVITVLIMIFPIIILWIDYLINGGDEK